MVSLTFYFFSFVAIFAIIGALRGWAKEILVTFSAVLGLAFITLLERYIPFISSIPEGSTAQFWFRSIIFVMMVFFGYQTPNMPGLAKSKFARERLQDWLLGFFIGALNGYLIAGTLWFWMDAAGYPFDKYISAPVPGTPMGDAAINMVKYLPPTYLGVPWVYFATVLAFVFVIVVFL